MKLFLVAGMHRSGTSFVTEVLHALGAAVGDDLLEPAADNPHGFFEHKGIKQVNDILLDRLGGAWDRPPKRLASTWPESPGLDRLRREAERLISELIAGAGGAPACVVKDPRFSLTGRFWSSVAAVDCSLIPIRDPAEVAQSLRHRNGFAPSRSALLWTRYTIDALLGLPHALPVALQDLIDEPSGAVGRLVESLGLDSSDVDLDAAVAIAKERGRTWRPDDVLQTDFDEREMMLARSVYGLLRSGAELSTLVPTLTAIADQWQMTSMITVDRLRHDDPADALGSALELADERLAELERELQSAGIDASDMRAERNEARRELRITAANLETEIQRRKVAEQRATDLDDRVKLETGLRTEAERRLLDVEQQLERAEERIRRAEAVVAEQSDQLNVEREQRDRFERDVASSRADARRLERMNDENAKRARAAERQFDRLSSRRSVRVALGISSPTRPLFRLVRRVRSGSAAGAQPKRGNRGSEGDPGRGQRRPGRATAAVPVGLRSDTGSRWSDIVDRLLGAPAVSVVVPVYNAPEAVTRCLESLVEWTPAVHEIVVIDDASPDPAIHGILESFSDRPNFRILRNESNLGFTRTVNRGFESTSGDVVILNSDARVTPNWLTNLRAAAYSADRIASASAVSDNAGAFSVPEPGVNPSPGLDDVSYARLFVQRGQRRWHHAPTGHGFCMYLRRQALDEIGGFDAASFPRGYGEENDWSMRALAAGWAHVVDDSTIVFHDNAASFSPEVKETLTAAAREEINRLHPGYSDAVRTFMQGPMAEVRSFARGIHEEARGRAEAGAASVATVRPRLLSVVHAGGGGTPKTNLDLMTNMEPDWDPWILTSDGRRIELSHVVDGVPVVVDHVRAGEPLGSNVLTDPTYRDFVSRIVLTMGFEVIHVRHLFKHSQRDIPDIVRALALPAVLSFHDFYWICPNVNLFDGSGVYCRGVCTPTPGDCDHPVPGKPLDVPLKHEWVYEWRHQTSVMLDSFDEFVTTSSSARELIQKHYPVLAARSINVIPHGRHLEQDVSVAAEPTSERVTLVMLGSLSGQKGGYFLRKLLDQDIDHVLDVHVFGPSRSQFDDLRCTFHGPYERESLADLLRPLRPAFAALFSVTPETWSHTLSEAWSMGLPALVSVDGGALFERVSEHGGGWVVDTSDPKSVLDRILAIANDPHEWRRQAERATIDNLPTVVEMGERYREVYASARRRSHPPAPVVDMYVVTDPGSITYPDGYSPGSAHVRSLRRFSHPAIAERVIVRRNPHRQEQTQALGPPDIVWVQRTALDLDEVDDVLGARDRAGARLVVDLDDDLLHADGLPRKFARYVPTMRRLVAEADLTLVSTEPLAEVVAAFTDRIGLLPNQLDERLWFADARPPRRKPEGEAIDVLYMGTETHGGDLDLLRVPFDRLRLGERREVRLWVIGGAAPTDDEWFHRITVPKSVTAYPAFVPWLQDLAPRFDFAVAPLALNDFNRSKSDLKFLEYAGLGLPAILSDCPAYDRTVTHDVDGVLTSNDPDAWLEALSAMLSREYQDTIRSGALATVSSRTIGATADDFVEMLTGLLSPTRFSTSRGAERQQPIQ